MARLGNDLVDLEARELAALDVRAETVRGDVSDPEEMARAVERAQRALGPLDALVCNAGIALPIQLLTDTTGLQWRQVMGTDLDGVFHTLQPAIPGMVSRKAGAIVTVSSMWGVTGGSCEAPYSAAKAGVIGMSKALAREVGSRGITVNCIAPGFIDTDMTKVLKDEQKTALLANIPLGRLGQTDDIANACVFLASDAGAYLTGTTLHVNGGMFMG